MDSINNDEPDDVLDESESELVPIGYSITSYGADYPVDGLVKRIDRDVIFIPEFQRAFVWTISKGSRFIESLLLGLPVPGIFLSKEPDTGRMLVIDGQQRLRTLQYFYTGVFRGKEFALSGVHEPFVGRTYSSLEPEDRNRLDDSIIHATVIKQDSPDDGESSVYHIFERLNTGGMQLQQQEIRACIFHGQLNGLLTELNELEPWRDLYGSKSSRLKDQELILRFFALYYFLPSYREPLKDFLNRYMKSNRNLERQDAKQLRSTFGAAVTLARDAFGKDAFRPERSLNAAFFDAIMVGLARRLETGPVTDLVELRRRHGFLVRSSDFTNAWKNSTASQANVKSRIETATVAFGTVP